MTLSVSDFGYLRDLIKSRSGISLTDDKVYLIESRLLPLSRVHGLQNISELVSKIRMGSNEDLIVEIIEAMTTNETSFFRDAVPFEAIKGEILPELIEARRGVKTLKIWSAACSTGQEPYSLGIMIRENFPELANWKVDILATDIAENKVIEKAKSAEYSQLEVSRGMPARLLVRYFKQKGRAWKLNPEVRDMVRFRKVNLLEIPSFLGNFDLILCRNVLIYFDNQTKTNILNTLQKHLVKDGFLMLGGSELLMGLTKTLKRRGLGRTTCYQHAGI